MKGNSIVSFLIGTVTGGLIVYLLMDKKVQQAREDAEETREVYRQMKKDISGEDKAKKEDEPKRTFRRVESTAEQNELKEEILKQRYNYSNVSAEEIQEETKKGGKTMIFEITSDEFDENDDYDRVTITWYKGQHILADDEDHKMSLECIGGESSVENFSNDYVKYIRNEALKIDYEVCLDDTNTWMDPEASDE